MPEMLYAVKILVIVAMVAIAAAFLLITFGDND
jgi:hypothetical protein